MIDYVAIYRTLRKARLLEILHRPDAYEAQAVTSAREELTRRGMTEVAIDVAIARFDVPVSSSKGAARVCDPAAFPDLLDVAEFDARAAQTWLDRWLVPGIVVYAGGLVLLSLADTIQRYLFTWNLNHSIAPWETKYLPFLQALTPALLVLTACVLLWRRSRWGWVGVTGYFTYTFINKAYSVFSGFFFQEYAHDSGLEALIYAIEHPAPTPFMMLSVVAIGGLLTLLLLPLTRAAVGVSGAVVGTTLGVGVLLGVGGVLLAVGS